MIKLIFKVFILLFLSVFLNTAFCSDVITDNQSIKELKNSLIELAKNKNELNVEFFILNQNQKLREFFRDDLTKNEVNQIKIIINNYLEAKKIIDTKIKIKASELLATESERNNLLNEKNQFYKDLISYIKRYKIPDYLEYIAQDVKILKEKRELSEKLIIQNEIIGNKVEEIEQKIREHREYLDEKFNTIINTIIDEKIESITNTEKYLQLNREAKILVLDKILVRIQITILGIEKKVDKTDVLIKKLEIYKKVYSKLNEFKNNL